jgi:MFS family permease
MNKRQFVALSLASVVPYAVGAGVLPLLSVYAAQLGAPPAITGYYLAFAYLAVTVGTLFCGWVSDRFGRRRALLAIAGALGIPATFAMGRVGGLWALTLSTAAVWFLGGTGMALTSILAGIFAGEDERGKVYGVLSLAGGVGSVIGGLVIGPLVDRWGYPTMFALLALVFALWPLAALILRDKRADQLNGGQQQKTGERAVVDERPVGGDKRVPERDLRLGTSFYLLFAANLVAAMAGFMGILGRSLSMDTLGFSASAISSTLAVSSAVTLPLPMLIGWLSDRLGRKRFLVLCYLISAVGLVLLSLSSALWHFWIAVTLTNLAGNLRLAIGPALTNDLIPRKSLGRGLGLFGATNWVGAIVGFTATGHAAQRLGLTPTLVGGAALPLIAVLLLVRVRQARDSGT